MSHFQSFLRGNNGGFDCGSSSDPKLTFFSVFDPPCQDKGNGTYLGTIFGVYQILVRGLAPLQKSVPGKNHIFFRKRF